MFAARRQTGLAGKLLMVGFGCLEQAVLPLLLRHIDLRPGQITIVSTGAEGEGIARQFGIDFERLACQAGPDESCGRKW